MRLLASSVPVVRLGRVMRGTRARTLLAALAALAVSGCASWFSARLDPPAGARLEDAWRLYQISEDRKAMAVAVDETAGRKVWGICYGSLSQERANREALSECESNAKRVGLSTTCHLMAIGNRRPPGAVRACADGRASRGFCELMNSLVPPDPLPDAAASG
jgi:hypothetical protein